ncbi:MAG: hypothetical protein ACREIF_17450 [Chthoniobacterales bacterium]
MKLRARELDFSRSTILLGDSIVQQLVESSRRSRRRWSELLECHSTDIAGLMSASRVQKVISHPFVSGFIAEWALNTNWGVRPPLHMDGVCLNVPPQLIESLEESGGVESFSLFIGDVGRFCCARLDSGDDHNEYRLIVNAPAWLEIATLPTVQHEFERQLKSVIQHEMAHFRHSKAGERTETHAHCRGIASVLPGDFCGWAPEDLYALILRDYYEFANNGEIRKLVLCGSEVTSRLIRRWQWLFATTRQNRDN